MNNHSNVTIERYLNSVYLSLARPAELTFKDGTSADGFFGGLDYATGNLLIRNFCPYGSLELQPEKRINIADLKYFVVKRIEKVKNQNMRMSSEHKQVTAKQNHKNDDNTIQPNDHSLVYVKNNKLTGFSNKKITKDSKRQSLKETPHQPVKNIHKNEFGFLTDKEISNKNVLNKHSGFLSHNKSDVKTKEEKGKEKVFEKWKPSGAIKGLEIHELEVFESTEKFDQFELNHIINKEKAEEFTEDDYTTKLRLEEFTQEDIIQADKLAQEILNAENTHGITTNHILEERGLKALVDNDDEEALYSAVIDTNCTFKFKNPKPLPKRKSFYEQIIKNWSKGRRKASELIETLSKPIESKSDSNSYSGLNKNMNGAYKNIYNMNQSSQYTNVYIPVS